MGLYCTHPPPRALAVWTAGHLQASERSGFPAELLPALDCASSGALKGRGGSCPIEGLSGSGGQKWKPHVINGTRVPLVSAGCWHNDSDRRLSLSAILRGFCGQTTSVLIKLKMPSLGPLWATSVPLRIIVPFPPPNLLVVSIKRNREQYNFC